MTCARATRAVRRDHLATRVARLYLGLAGFGVSLALMVRARLGLDPWDVLQSASRPTSGSNWDG